MSSVAEGPNRCEAPGCDEVRVLGLGLCRTHALSDLVGRELDRIVGEVSRRLSIEKKWVVNEIVYLSTQVRRNQERVE